MTVSHNATTEHSELLIRKAMLQYLGGGTLLDATFSTQQAWWAAKPIMLL